MSFRKLLCIFVLSYILGCGVHGQFVYLNSGVFKFIAGIGIPIDVEMSGGSVSWFSNFQVFYKLPDNITYYEPYKIMEKRSVKNTLNRQAVYQALNKYFERLGFYGSECLHRLICEITRRKVNRSKNGLLGEIIHILFSPTGDSQQGLEEYKNAHREGIYNTTHCGLIYKDCFVKEDSVFLT